jgi:hypothetical protein
MSQQDAFAVDPSQRLWELLRPTLSHDLPNMLVALQGLLQMLRQEETNRLSSGGLEYLKRLSALGQKLQGMVTTLRQLSRLSGAAPAEEIAVAEMLRELAAACKQLLPRAHVIFHSSLKVPHVHAPRLLLHQSLLEITRLLAAQAPPGDLHCFVASRRGNGEVELTIGAWTDSLPTSFNEARTPVPAPRPGASPRGLDYNLFGPENRLGLVLIEEMARNWGGRAETFDVPAQGKWIRVTVPEQARAAPKPPSAAGLMEKSLDP